CDLVLLLPCLAVPLEGLLNRVYEILIPKWFRQKLHCPGLHGFDCHGNVSVTGDENDRNLNAYFSQFTLHIQPTHPRQSHIQKKAAGTIWKLVPQEVLWRRKRLGMQTYCL